MSLRSVFLFHSFGRFKQHYRSILNCKNRYKYNIWLSYDCASTFSFVSWLALLAWYNIANGKAKVSEPVRKKWLLALWTFEEFYFGCNRKVIYFCAFCLFQATQLMETKFSFHYANITDLSEHLNDKSRVHSMKTRLRWKADNSCSKESRAFSTSTGDSSSRTMYDAWPHMPPGSWLDNHHIFTC